MDSSPRKRKEERKGDAVSSYIPLGHLSGRVSPGVLECLQRYRLRLEDSKDAPSRKEILDVYLIASDSLTVLNDEQRVSPIYRRRVWTATEELLARLAMVLRNQHTDLSYKIVLKFLQNMDVELLSVRELCLDVCTSFVECATALHRPMIYQAMDCIERHLNIERLHSIKEVLVLLRLLLRCTRNVPVQLRDDVLDCLIDLHRSSLLDDYPSLIFKSAVGFCWDRREVSYEYLKRLLRIWPSPDHSQRVCLGELFALVDGLGSGDLERLTRPLYSRLLACLNSGSNVVREVLLTFMSTNEAALAALTRHHTTYVLEFLLPALISVRRLRDLPLRERWSDFLMETTQILRRSLRCSRRRR